MRNEKLAPVHPGEILMEEFLKPMNLSQNRLALSMGVPAVASTKWSWESEALPPIPPLNWHAISACRLISGWASKWTMRSTLPWTNLQIGWRLRSGGIQGRVGDEGLRTLCFSNGHTLRFTTQDS